MKKLIEHDDTEGQEKARVIFLTSLKESIAKMPDKFDLGLFAMDMGDEVTIGIVGRNKDIVTALLSILMRNEDLRTCFDAEYLPILEDQLLDRIKGRFAEASKTNHFVDMEGGNA